MRRLIIGSLGALCAAGMLFAFSSGPAAASPTATSAGLAPLTSLSPLYSGCGSGADPCNWDPSQSNPTSPTVTMEFGQDYSFVAVNVSHNTNSYRGCYEGASGWTCDKYYTVTPNVAQVLVSDILTGTQLRAQLGTGVGGSTNLWFPYNP